MHPATQVLHGQWVVEHVQRLDHEHRDAEALGERLTLGDELREQPSYRIKDLEVKEILV